MLMRTLRRPELLGGIRHGFFHVLHLDRLIHLGHEGLDKGILQQRGVGHPNVDIRYFLIFSS